MADLPKAPSAGPHQVLVVVLQHVAPDVVEDLYDEVSANLELLRDETGITVTPVYAFPSDNLIGAEDRHYGM